MQDTIGDVDGLHSKLERKSNVESSNLNAVALHQSNMHSAVDALRHGVQGYSDAQLQACSQFTARISESLLGVNWQLTIMLGYCVLVKASTI